MRKFALTLAAMVGVMAALLVATAPDALADPAGPTDYNTVIVSVEPATQAFRVEIIGGDSFMRLQQLEAVEIVVLGYQGEPYLRFDPSGAVFENRRSPATWLNQDRFGDGELPSYVQADAPPQWFPVASRGDYSWHDHRSHWMNPQRPPGAEPGDQVLEAVVPLLVDGEPVNVTVASYLLDSPSKWPTRTGALAALSFGALSARLSRAWRGAIVAATAAAATVVGTVAFTSVPPETRPSQLLWLLPLLAAAASVVMVLIRRLTATTVYLDGLLVTAGVCLATSAFLRRDALQRALIPSDAPASIDRFVIAAGLVVGTIAAVHGLVGLIRPQRLIDSAPGAAMDRLASQ